MVITALIHKIFVAPGGVLVHVCGISAVLGLHEVMLEEP